MIVYLDEATFPLVNTPAPLRQKKFYEEVNAWYTTFGVRAHNLTGDGVLHVDISQAASKQAVFSFLEATGAICVDLEPADLGVLGGRHIAVLAGADLLNVDPAVRQGCSRLEISEIMDTIAELERLALAVSQKSADAREDLLASFGDEEGLRANVQGDLDAQDRAAMDRLRRAGFDVGEEVDLSKPPSSFPDLEEYEHPDFSADVSRRNADPFLFSNNE
jgi:hypothetical protein